MNDSSKAGSEWFKAAADASLDSLFVAKGVRDEAGQLVDFECIDVNGRALRMLGIAREQIIGQKLWGLLPINRETFFDKYAQVLATGSPLDEEFPVDTPEAKAKWLRQQVVRVGDGIAVSARDVTRWKESGARLKESEERLRLATEAAHMGAWTWDPKTDRFSFSEGIGPVFGLPRGEGFHTPEEMIKAVYLADRDIVANALLQGREKGTSARVEVRTLWPDGTLHWVQSESNFIRDATGAVERGVGIAMDITERKQAEQVLRESERRFSTLLGNVELVSLMRDREGKITYCNEYLLRLTGWRQEEIIGRNWIELFIPPEIANEKKDVFAALIANRPEAWHHEHEILTRSGEHRLIHWNNSVLRSGSGEVIGTASIGEDITEQRRAIKALQQEHATLLRAQQQLLNAHESLAKADRLESAGRLAAGVAHEVKNPLTIIRLGIDYLAKQFPQDGSQEVLNDVREAIDRAEHVIRDLLEFSRQKPVALRPTSIDDVIDNAIRLIKHEIDRRNIAIIRNRDDAMPIIYADPERLVQVFINLLGNAAQAIAQNGSIEIVERATHLGEQDLARSEKGVFRIGEPVITVDIRDNGPGISTEHQNKLFEPFFTTKPQGEGSGLGLAVARNIVILHGGTISIANRPEGGASALLTFRVAEEHLTNEKANTGSG